MCGTRVLFPLVSILCCATCPGEIKRLASTAFLDFQPVVRRTHTTNKPGNEVPELAGSAKTLPALLDSNPRAGHHIVPVQARLNSGHVPSPLRIRTCIHRSVWSTYSLAVYRPVLYILGGLFRTPSRPPVTGYCILRHPCSCLWKLAWLCHSPWVTSSLSLGRYIAPGFGKPDTSREAFKPR